MDNKPARRKIIKSEDVRQYERAERNKKSMRDSLDRIGYRSPEEYRDTVSQYAW